MLNKEIYDCALGLLAESTDDGANDDYEERAPYLLAAFCAEAHNADKALRHSHSEQSAVDFSPVYLGLEEQFPLLECFAAPAALYLAAMLVMDYNDVVSDKLYDRYSDSMSSICSSIPALTEHIKDRYYFV